MKIGIIGAGNIGGTLGRVWSAAGHEIKFGVREPQSAKFNSLRSAGEVSSVGEAAAFGDVVLLALPGSAVADFAAHNAKSLAGKVIIDAANNVGSTTMHNLDTLHRHVSQAQLVRAFNSLGWENFAEPQVGGEQIDLFYCGDLAARDTAEQLIRDVGLRPIYIGGVETAAALDGMTRVWFALVYGQSKGRHVAFKLLIDQG
ncbi:MAG: NAD(P)-binding domain-containing protein [Caldilineales bacterium]|nr:NAD(P)-binding domain-containing protein [Caldilineales bacterium]